MPKVKYTSAKGLYQETGTNEIDLGSPATVKVKANKAPSMQQLVFMYDFSTQGGGQGEITLTDVNGNAMSIPRGFVIFDGLVEVVTAVTSAGSATVAVGTAGTSDDPDGFLTATGKASWTLSALLTMDGALLDDTDGQAVTRKKIVTTDDPVTMTIATADLTAGKFYVVLRGYHSLSVA